MGRWIALSRPRDWTKNVFVLMPVPFALGAGAVLHVPSFALGLVGFCLVSSGIYAWNDVFDADRDRSHPEKRHRPVASGQVSRRDGSLFGLALVAAGSALVAASAHAEALWIVGAYVILNLLYAGRGRQVPLLDVFLLSSGYVLRVLLGCALLDVRPSQWLLLCSSALALFLTLAKRRGDLARGIDSSHRPSLSGYNAAFLEQAMGISAGITLVAYALYCIDAEVLVPGREFSTLPFAVFGVLEYLRLVHVHQLGDSPVDVLLGSRVLLACGAGWALAALGSVAIL